MSSFSDDALPFALVLCRFCCLIFYGAFCQMLLLPLCKFPLPFRTLIEGQNVRQDAAGNGLDLMLWYGGVIDQLFLSAQRIPPSGLSASSYWSHCCCQSVGGFAPSTILLQIPLQNLTSPSFPFRVN